ncbi:DEAD/DEAH box helicase [Planctopirus hydrillae]|uniref:Type III restriction endonuclease subunit R n=1 Tax=Planctopirus hydrillae TaxID=1841610 RepID=A0A1C3E936_9PLAN|nr:DEAD/DEAH box helicase family protein [Planctopirus hydrillae]ODA29731.1 hypothetical protein A6X21_07525 [Planctopirus hydrillae]
MRSYFDTYAGDLRFVERDASGSGLRRAQRGAVFAIGSHFSLSTANALVSMPTGTGKTAVLMMAPYLLRASRTLIITPSRMVRDQIAEEYGSLALLKRLAVLPENVTSPNVQAIESKILRDEQWGQLNAADVVVTTPMGSSPALDEIPHPPNDLFDLLLIDEAHHSPAKTWRALMQAFPSARQILFTATPFRRDRQQLPGDFVYEFPLREALRDGVFSSITFVGCESEAGVSNDIIIAKKAEQIYRDDRAQGLDHRVMVRTDSRARAHELHELYQRETTLQLATIHGQHSLMHVRRTVKRLRDAELDGVICVDMFGEGVDMPQLKIAAIHSPHRSLAVTLQFIGRFARTGAANLGVAKFIAVPEEIETETKTLYQQGAIWEQLVTNLADSRVVGERELRQQLRSFSPTYDIASENELTLSVIKPWYHSKVFHVPPSVDLHALVDFGSGIEIVQRFVSDDLHCAAFVCQSVNKPRWMEALSLQDVTFHLFIIYHDQTHGLLFINSSVKTEDMYSQIAEQVVNGAFTGVSTATINRALRALQNPAFFSVGLKNRLFGNQVESYRIISGGRADGAVSNTDAQLFDRGHLFGSGDSDEGKVTLGISTLSKIWSNRAGFVPEYVAWCHAVAEHLANSAPVVTGSRIDLLATGEEVTSIPTAVIGATWHETAYRLRPLVTAADPVPMTVDLLSLEMSIERFSNSEVRILLHGLGDPIPINFRISGSPYFSLETTREIAIETRTQTGSFADYLNSFGLHLYLADFARLYKNQLFHSNLTLENFPASALHRRDWASLNVDICCEVGTSENGISIHAGIESVLVSSNAAVVVYDHRSGEIADYVSIREEGGAILCDVFHCKGSNGERPGSRVSDAYEVAGQVVKSVVLARSPATLKTELTRRLASGSLLKKGSLSDLERLLDDAEHGRFEFHVLLVQPGISAGTMSDPVSRVLAAAYDYVLAATGFAPTFWISD